MKKILLSVVCLLVVGIQSVKAQVAIAALHHHDSVTIYAPAQLQSAIDAAEAGDTIYLSEGIFGGFTVAKPISIIGAGQATGISNDITIGKSDTPTEAGLLLSCLHIFQDVNFQYEVDGVRISQCKIEGNCDFGSYYSNSTGRGPFSNIEIMMSQISGYLRTNSNIQGINIYGSKIKSATHTASSTNSGTATYLHCNIGSTGQNGALNSYTNCILNTAAFGVFNNCLYGTSPGTSSNRTIVNCYQTTFEMGEDLESPLSDEELREAGYLGVDGAVVGITGGEVPFTLVSPTLQVTEHNLEVDNVEKKLKVTLTLGNK